MIPAYIIHSSACEDRDILVKKLIEETGATVVEAVYPGNPTLGCSLSHYKVAAWAKKIHPDLPYLVMEDDCVFFPGWKEALFDISGEVVYLGYNDKLSHGLLTGTHAMLIYPRARDAILEKLPLLMKEKALPYDWLVWKLWIDENISVGFPDKKNQLCEQAKGFRSTITGNIR